MNRTDLKSQVEAARTLAMEWFPAYEPALSRLRISMRSHLHRVSCVSRSGRVVIGVKPLARLQKKMQLKQIDALLAFLLTHSMLHYLRNHGERGRLVSYPTWLQQRNATIRAKAWVLAADLEINDSLREVILSETDIPPDLALLPEDLCLPRRLVADEYLEKMTPEMLHFPFVDEGSACHLGQGTRPWEQRVKSTEEPDWSARESASIFADVMVNLLRAFDRNEIMA
ncbi:hypothetical protein SH501x_003219 [Pirellulaceae bacterium SH501]